MYSLNRVQLMGNLTVTPENKSTANSNYCDFSIAINKKYKNSNGEMVESVQFANCKCWGRVQIFYLNTQRRGRRCMLKVN